MLSKGISAAAMAAAKPAGTLAKDLNTWFPVGAWGSFPRLVLRKLGMCVRETGQAMDRAGMVLLDNNNNLDHFSRHRQLMPFSTYHPLLAKDSWVAPSAALIGKVAIGSKASVWYGAVLKGDVGSVTVGERSNVQDDTVITASSIGDGVTIGHGVIIESSTIGDNAFIGMKSVIRGSTVEAGGMVAAGAVLREGTVVKKGQLFTGAPAAYKRDMKPSEVAQVGKTSREYHELALDHEATIRHAPASDRLDSEIAKGTLEEAKADSNTLWG